MLILVHKKISKLFMKNRTTPVVLPTHHFSWVFTMVIQIDIYGNLVAPHAEADSSKPDINRVNISDYFVIVM